MKTFMAMEHFVWCCTVGARKVRHCTMGKLQKNGLKWSTLTNISPLMFNRNLIFLKGDYKHPKLCNTNGLDFFCEKKNIVKFATTKKV